MSAPSNLSRNHPRMCAFSYASSLPVTWHRWRSHHSIRRSWKPHATCRVQCSMFYRTAVIAHRSFTLREQEFLMLLAHVTLTFIYKPNAKMNVLRWGFQKLWYEEREIVHLVMHGHFQSHDEDGGHTIQSTVVENAMIRANLEALSVIEPELQAIKVLHGRNRNFQRFWLLWPRPWPDDLHIWTWPVLPEIHGCANMNFLRHGFRKLSSDRQMNYAWSLLVALQRWQSDQSIRRSQKPHDTCKPHGSICYRTGVMGNQSFTLRK